MKILTSVIAYLTFLSASTCFAMNMNVADNTCHFDTKYLEVAVADPVNGYYATVNANKTINFTSNPPEGTLLSVSVSPTYCMEQCENNFDYHCMPNCFKDINKKLIGPWTAAKNNGVLPVHCFIDSHSE